MPGDGGIAGAIADALGGGGDGGSPTTTSPSSTTTSSSSGGSTQAAPKTEAQILALRRAQHAFAELRRSYLESIRRLGMKPSKNLMNLVEKGVRGAWSSTQFVAMLRHTPEYRQKFKGIQWKEGMTEGTYNSTFAQYQARAQDLGIKLTREDFAKLLKRGVDMDEFSERVDALGALKNYAPMWDQFKTVLDERGIKVPGGTLGKKEMVDFIMGRGSKQWEQAWQETYLAVNLEKVAGIGVTYTNEGTPLPDDYAISRGDMVNIINQVESLSGGQFDVKSLTPQNFAEIGARLRKYNRSYLQRYGITTKDLLEMELGGPNAARIREKADRILAEQEAFTEPRATPQYAKIQQAGQQEELPQTL